MYLIKTRAKGLTNCINSVRRDSSQTVKYYNIHPKKKKKKSHILH